MAGTTVAVIKTKASTVIEDIDRLVQMAGIEQALPKDKTTILKDNISWHMPFLSANTTPWQLEGVIKALKKRDYQEIVCVENRTVVTNAAKGERLNRYTHVLADNDIPVKCNFKPDHMHGSGTNLKPKCWPWIRYFQKEFIFPITSLTRISFICRP